MLGIARHMWRDERGSVVVMIGALLALLLVFAVYAIDASQMLLVKSQLQNAADAGALAGAVTMGLAGDSTAAVNEAISFAGLNDALLNTGTANEMQSVVITAGDVTFPNSGQIRVTTHRTDATGDAFLNYFLRIFDNNGEIGEMTAQATATFEWVCGANCLKPWCPPDRWDDLDSDGRYDAGEPYDPVTTGYTDSDLGAQVTLVLGNGNQTGFGEFWYYSVDFPPINKGNPISGADQYGDWICLPCVDNSFVVEPGDDLRVEPGNMVGPNRAGLDCLIGSDPSASWDAASGTVVGSPYAVSPRVVKVALFNPVLGLRSDAGGKYLHVVKIMVVFVERRQGNDQIVGRFMRLAEPDGTVCANQSDPSFLFRTSLIE